MSSPAPGPAETTRPPGKSNRGATERTVLVAGAANLVVMVAKLAAGVATGSSAMLAEAAHSFADTLNQVFLLISVREGQRPADSKHPFGHGQDRYFWSLLAAFGIFVAGGGFSVFEGILSLHTNTHDFVINYVVLGVSAVAEGTSFFRASSQLRNEARRAHTELLDHVRHSRDTTVKAAFFEDTAALIGLALAAGGLVAEQLTGSPVWDGAASIAIGVLLVVVAIRLGMDSRELLIGRAADPQMLRTIREDIEHTPGVDKLLELRTMHVGPDALIVAARVALKDHVTADQVEDLADDIDRRLSHDLPVTPYVFIDPTQTSADPGRGARHDRTPRRRARAGAAAEPAAAAEQAKDG
jgi:cation diffusion facilitator family transporter